MRRSLRASAIRPSIAPAPAPSFQLRPGRATATHTANTARQKNSPPSGSDR